MRLPQSILADLEDIAAEQADLSTVTGKLLDKATTEWKEECATSFTPTRKSRSKELRPTLLKLGDF